MIHCSDAILSPAETRNLHRIAAMMIPASEAYGVPGADDPVIFTDIVRSLGMELRPPFPKGHVVEQGDWSLLDPVRNRPSFWRNGRAG